MVRWACRLIWVNGRPYGRTGRTTLVSIAIVQVHTNKDLCIHLVALNPDPNNKPVLDPKDQALMADPSGSGYSNGDLTPRAAARASVPQTPANVTWLRKTEYLSRDTAALTRTPTQEVYVLHIPRAFVY